MSSLIDKEENFLNIMEEGDAKVCLDAINNADIVCFYSAWQCTRLEKLS